MTAPPSEPSSAPLPAELPNFERVLARFAWRPIRDCPGRYVLGRQWRLLAPAALLGAEVRVEEHAPPETPDRVLVCRFPGGGLLSFRKPDGTFVHTLATTEGLARRLARFGIAPAG